MSRREVSEIAIGRYQNIRGQQHMVCPPGTLLFLHHGIWHGGGVNRSDRTRYMFKIRAHASGSQVRRRSALHRHTSAVAVTRRRRRVSA